MITLSVAIRELFKKPGTVKVLATTDERGNPHVVFKESLTVLDDGSIAYAEALESSLTNCNMLRSIWFNNWVAVTILDKDDTCYLIKGKPARYIVTGPAFKQFYVAEQERLGPDADIAGVWIITPEEVREETFAARKREEERKHPFFIHFERWAATRHEGQGRPLG